MDGNRFETREIHAGTTDDAHGAVVTPIYANSTYEYGSPTETRGDYRYARMGAPTRDDLESLLADLEGGSRAAAFASGMAAIDAVFGLLSPGDHVVAGRNLYAETHDLLTDVYATYGVTADQIDTSDGDVLADAVDDGTDLVYLETPSNPVLDVADVGHAADVAAEHDALLAVDNTFASPALQRPLELGADLVVESLTKYVGGHSDLVAGAVATDDPDLADELAETQVVRGAIPGPFECFQALRGAKTLSMRMDRHCGNARAVASFFDDDPRVETVYYPGLTSHPNHDTAAEQMADFGGMVSFELDGDRDAAARFLEALEVFTLAESLGAVESLVEVPALMTHQDLDREALSAAGIDEALIRLSVGLEHRADLLADLEEALAVALD